MFWTIVLLGILFCFVLPILYNVYDDYKNGRINRKSRAWDSKNYNFTDDLDFYHNMMSQVIKWYSGEEQCPYKIQSISIGNFSDPAFANKPWLCIKIKTKESKETIMRDFNNLLKAIGSHGAIERDPLIDKFFNYFSGADVYDTHCESCPFGGSFSHVDCATLKKALGKYNQEHFPNVSIQIN